MRRLTSMTDKYTRIVTMLLAESLPRANHPMTTNQHFIQAVNHLADHKDMLDSIFISASPPNIEEAHGERYSIQIFSETEQFILDLRSMVQYYECMAGIIEITTNLLNLLEDTRELIELLETETILIVKYCY
ncbi:MAG: hypothetical protein OWR52_12550 [Acidibacillus sp.]|nr:hypothetical protein [Acidibacillus sp.]